MAFMPGVQERGERVMTSATGVDSSCGPLACGWTLPSDNWHRTVSPSLPLPCRLAASSHTQTGLVCVAHTATGAHLQPPPQVTVCEGARQGTADARLSHQHAALPLAGQLREHVHDVHVRRHLRTWYTQPGIGAPGQPVETAF